MIYIKLKNILLIILCILFVFLGFDYSYANDNKTDHRFIFDCSIDDKLMYKCQECEKITTEYVQQLMHRWSNENLNCSAYINNDNLYDFINDNIINAKDYAFLYNLSKTIDYKIIYDSDFDEIVAEKYYIANGKETGSTSRNHTIKIPVGEGKKYFFKCSNSFIGITMHLWSDNTLFKAYTTWSNGVAGCKFIEELENSRYPYNDNTALDREMAYFTIPEGVNYVTFNLNSNQSFILYENGYPNDIVHSYESNIYGVNNLTEKSFCAMGTSITAGTKTLETWATFIAQANNMQFNNLAIGGSVLFDIVNQVDYLNKYDYVIVDGFANDLAKRPSVGSLSKENDNFDTNTFIGCLENFICDFKRNSPNSKLGFVLTDGKKYPKYADIYWEAAISVFEKYDIPYIDFRQIEYSTSDGTHPTWDGQLIMAKNIEKWMNTL